MDLRLIGRKEVLKMLSVSSATLHRGMIEGRFPKPYSLGEGSSRVAWKSSELKDYIDSLLHSDPTPVAPGCQGRKPSATRGV